MHLAQTNIHIPTQKLCASGNIQSRLFFLPQNNLLENNFHVFKRCIIYQKCCAQPGKEVVNKLL